MTDLNYASPGEPTPFRNLKSRFVAVGVILIVLAAISACVGTLTPVALFIPQQSGAPQTQVKPTVRDVVVGAAVYLAAAGLGIAVGIGAIRTRRWSRPLILIGSFHWLIGGVVALVGMLVTMPGMNQEFARAQAQGAGLPPAGMMTAITLVVGGLFLLLVGIALPAALMWVMKDPDAKLTVDYFDPTPRWTDGRSVFVLGAALTFWLLALLALMSTPAMLLTIFGKILTGAPAILLVLVYAAIFTAAGWMSWQRQMLGLVIGAAMALFWCASWMVSSWTIPPEMLIRAVNPDAPTTLPAIMTGDYLRTAGAVTALMYGLVVIGCFLAARAHFSTRGDTSTSS
jgi:hypothetical protein